MVNPYEIVYSKRNASGTGFDEKILVPAADTLVIVNHCGDLATSIETTASLNITASQAITASYALIASQAITASYALITSQVLTASYAITSSTVNNFPFDTVSAILNITESAVMFFQKSTGSFNAVFFDYYTKSGSNQRAGVMFGTWADVLSYTEQTTMDIGNTSDIAISMTLSMSSIQFLAVAQTTENWNIKGFIRYL